MSISPISLSSSQDQLNTGRSLLITASELAQLAAGLRPHAMAALQRRQITAADSPGWQYALGADRG